MPVVRISEKSMQRLKAWAEPLEDTTDSALEKALDAAERHLQARPPKGPDAVRPPEPGRERRRKEATPLKKKKTPQKAFRAPLLEALYEFGGGARVHDLRPAMKKRMESRLLPGDFDLVTGGQERWWNAVCWERSNLAKEGYFRGDSRRGVWALSEEGIGWVEARLAGASGNFVDHLLAMPDVGEESDFDRPRSGPRRFEM